MSALLSALGFALLLTVLSEGTAAYLLMRSPRYVLFNYWCNVLTNPLLNLGLFLLRRMQIPVWAERGYILAAELLVVLAEAAICGAADRHALPKRKYLRFSVITNAVSFLLGAVISLCISR